MKTIVRVSLLSGLLVLVGCAHPYNIAPNMASLESKGGTKIQKNVGYFISAEDRAKQVVTPGGGGDKVQYVPYRDLEPALYRVLLNSFNEVHVLKTVDDKAFIGANKISYVFIPKIETESSSSSAFTWPPTKFTVSLQCRALSPSGAVVWEKTIKGDGEATFSEFRSDLSLAGRRASENALLELQRQLQASPAFK